MGPLEEQSTFSTTGPSLQWLTADAYKVAYVVSKASPNVGSCPSVPPPLMDRHEPHGHKMATAFKTPVLFSFLFTVTKYLTRSNLMGEGSIWAQGLREYSPPWLAGNGSRWVHEV